MLKNSSKRQAFIVALKYSNQNEVALALKITQHIIFFHSCDTKSLKKHLSLNQLVETFNNNLDTKAFN